MRKNKKKLNKGRLIFAIVVLIGLILIIKGITSFVLSGKEPKEISLLLDNELVKVKNEIIKEKDTIYLSKDDIENLFDSSIYYNPAEKELITTFNKHIALLKIDEKFMVVNDSNAELSNPMIEKNGKVYLPFSEMGIVYDLEFEYSESTKKLIADSTNKAKSQALTLKKYNMKDKPNIFSGTVEKVEHGEYVNIVEDANKKYFKVRTAKGNIGYIKKKRLSEPEKLRDDWNEEKQEYAVIKDASDISKKYSDAKLESEKQNIVIPTFFNVEKGGEILDKTGSETAEFTAYTEWAKEHNVEIWASLENNEDVSKLLMTYTDRNKVINELYKKLVEHQFSGVNINFKKIDDVNSFNRFIIELTPRLKELGIKVAVTKNEYVDSAKLEKVVHLVIE